MQHEWFDPLIMNPLLMKKKVKVTAMIVVDHQKQMIMARDFGEVFVSDGERDMNPWNLWKEETYHHLEVQEYIQRVVQMHKRFREVLLLVFSVEPAVVGARKRKKSRPCYPCHDRHFELPVAFDSRKGCLLLILMKLCCLDQRFNMKWQHKCRVHLKNTEMNASSA